MNQIDAMQYMTALEQDGLQTIHKYGIACYKKTCKILYRKWEK